jgi:hypothetical protein
MVVTAIRKLNTSAQPLDTCVVVLDLCKSDSRGKGFCIIRAGQTWAGKLEAKDSARPRPRTSYATMT